MNKYEIELNGEKYIILYYAEKTDHPFIKAMKNIQKTIIATYIAAIIYKALEETVRK